MMSHLPQREEVNPKKTLQLLTLRFHVKYQGRQQKNVQGWGERKKQD